MALTIAMVVCSSHYKISVSGRRQFRTDTNSISIVNIGDTFLASTMTGTTLPIGETKRFGMLLTGSVEVPFATWIVSSSKKEAVIQFAPCFYISNSSWKLIEIDGWQAHPEVCACLLVEGREKSSVRTGCRGPTDRPIGGQVVDNWFYQ